MHHKQDSAEWILRTTGRILTDVGPKAARRFLDSRAVPPSGNTLREKLRVTSCASREDQHRGPTFLVPLSITCMNQYHSCTCRGFVPFSIQIYSSLNHRIACVIDSACNPVIQAYVVNGPLRVRRSCGETP